MRSKISGAELITVKQLSDDIGVSARSIHRWISKGTFPMPYLETPAGVVVTRKAFDSWLVRASEEVPMTTDTRAVTVAMYSNYLVKQRKING